MYWQLKGDTFEIVADYITPERKAALREKRGDDDSFCSRSKDVTLSKDGNGPVATAYREQVADFVGDGASFGGDADGGGCEFGIAQMKRADLAKEFGIQAIRFEPADGGVVEIGRAVETEVLKQKVLEYKAAYAMFWASSAGSFEIVADYITPERKAALREKRGDDESFCSRSKGVTLSKNGNGPVATAYRTQKPTLAGDASGIGGGGEACEFGLHK